MVSFLIVELILREFICKLLNFWNISLCCLSFKLYWVRFIKSEIHYSWSINKSLSLWNNLICPRHCFKNRSSSSLYPLYYTGIPRIEQSIWNRFFWISSKEMYSSFTKFGFSGFIMQLNSQFFNWSIICKAASLFLQ